MGLNYKGGGGDAGSIFTLAINNHHGALISLFLFQERCWRKEEAAKQLQYLYQYRYSIDIDTVSFTRFSHFLRLCKALG